MIAALGDALNRWSRRWVPDPFALALGLTLIVGLVGYARLAAGAAPTADGAGPAWTVFGGWLAGVKNAGLLAFALKMCLILVTGHALALSPPIQRLLVRIAQVPRSPAAATTLVAAVSCGAAVIHWGLGAVAGALLAREIGRHAGQRGLAIHYPLLGAAAYGGFAVWHGGLTGSAPTEVARQGHINAELVGAIPLSETLGGPLNLVITSVLIALIVVLFRALTPRDEAACVAPDPDRLAPLPSRERPPIESPIHWLQESPVVGAVLGGAALAVVVSALVAERIAIDLDSVVLLFLFLSIAAQGSLRCYAEAIADGARGAGAIILQFPFYFGILGIMKSSGMIAWISDAMVAVASETAMPVLAFLSAGLVNLFVPSGGGQWAVQGDILLTAGAQAGVDPATTVMAFAYGDAWTNTLQPFWALPLLGIMGLRARDIIGYTAMLFFVMGIAVPVLLLVLPALF